MPLRRYAATAYCDFSRHCRYDADTPLSIIAHASAAPNALEARLHTRQVRVMHAY